MCGSAGKVRMGEEDREGWGKVGYLKFDWGREGEGEDRVRRSMTR